MKKIIVVIILIFIIAVSALVLTRNSSLFQGRVNEVLRIWSGEEKFKIYKNIKGDYEIKYPSSWYLFEQDETVFFSPSNLEVVKNPKVFLAVWPPVFSKEGITAEVNFWRKYDPESKILVDSSSEQRVKFEIENIGDKISRVVHMPPPSDYTATPIHRGEVAVAGYWVEISNGKYSQVYYMYPIEDKDIRVTLEGMANTLMHLTPVPLPVK